MDLDAWERDGDGELFLESGDDLLRDGFERWSYGVPVIWEDEEVAIFGESACGLQGLGADDFVRFDHDVQSAIRAVRLLDLGAFSREVTWVLSAPLWEVPVGAPDLVELDAVHDHAFLDRGFVEGQPTHLHASGLGVSDLVFILQRRLCFVLIEERLEFRLAWIWDVGSEEIAFDQCSVHCDRVEPLLRGVHRSQIRERRDRGEHAVEAFDPSRCGECAIDLVFGDPSHHAGREGDVACERGLELDGHVRECLGCLLL